MRLRIAAERIAVGHRTGGIGGAIGPIRAGAEHHHVGQTRYVDRGCQYELLVPSAQSAALDGNRGFTASDEACRGLHGLGGAHHFPRDGRMHAAIAREVVGSSQPVKPPACLITGGETTVTIKGGGLGGRNQEFVLAAAIDIAGLPNMVVFSAGTDGTDGPTDAAGAVADGDTLRRNPEAQRFLDANDSYRYFESLGDLVITGPTNTNVMDVRIVLIGLGK